MADRKVDDGELTADQKINMLWERSERPPYRNPLFQYPLFVALVTVFIWIAVPAFMQNASVPAWIHKTFFRTNAALHWSISEPRKDAEMREAEGYSSSLHRLISQVVQDELLAGIDHAYAGSHVFSYKSVVDSSIACRIAADPGSAQLLGVDGFQASNICSDHVYPTSERSDQQNEPEIGAVFERVDQLQVRLSQSYIDFERQWSLPVLAPDGAILAVWVVARRSDGLAGQSLLDYYVDESNKGKTVPTTIGSSRSTFYVPLGDSRPSPGRSLHFITFRLNALGEQFMNNRGAESDPRLLLDVFVEITTPEKAG